MPDNKKSRSKGEKLEHVSYEGLSNQWVSAEHLITGDRILLADGSYDIIQEVYIEKLDESEVTYNLEVAYFHTYYVGENGVLTHNAGGPCGGIESSVPEGYEPTYKNGVYEANPKHGSIAKGNISKGISQEYGQYALDNAIPFKGGGKALYAYNGNDVLQFMPHEPGVYHGFSTSLGGVNNPAARNWLGHHFKIK